MSVSAATVEKLCKDMKIVSIGSFIMGGLMILSCVYIPVAIPIIIGGLKAREAAGDAIDSQALAAEFEYARVIPSPARGADPRNWAVTNAQDIVAYSGFLVTDIDYKEKFLFSGLFRQERSSLFGPEERNANYYRVNIAVNTEYC